MTELTKQSTYPREGHLNNQRQGLTEKVSMHRPEVNPKSRN